MSSEHAPCNHSYRGAGDNIFRASWLVKHNWTVQHLHIRTYMCRYKHMHCMHRYTHSQHTYGHASKQTKQLPKDNPSSISTTVTQGCGERWDTVHPQPQDFCHLCALSLYFLGDSQKRSHLIPLYAEISYLGKMCFRKLGSVRRDMYF